MKFHNGKRIKRVVEKGIRTAGERTQKAAIGAGRYVGEIAKRKMTEKVEDFFGAPIGTKERQAYNIGYQQARAEYWYQRAKQEHRIQPQVNFLDTPIKGKKKGIRFL